MADKVASAEAWSVNGPTVGFADVTTSTSDENVDLSTWKGRYVEITTTTAAHYILFDSDGTTTIETGAGAVGDTDIPGIIAADSSKHMIVPVSNPFLIYRTVSGTGEIRVHAL